MLFAKSVSSRSITSVLGWGVITLTSLLTACSGGGGSSSAPAPNTPATVSISVTPAMGMFKDNSTVTISDNQGKSCGTGKTSGGVAKITITPTTCLTPLIVQAGVAGDQYFNEATGLLVAITGTQGIHAVIPNTSYTSIGVTPLTDIAAASLINTTTGGLNTGVTAASVTTQNATIAKLLSNGNVTDPLAVPAAASSSTSQATNSYGAVLAMLSALVPGQTPQAIANNLALDLADGTWDGSASGTTIQGAVVPASFGTAMAAAATAVSASVNATAAPTIAITAAYVPTANIVSAVAAVGSGTTIPAADPIATARSLFTSLRTNANLMANPGQTGFLNTQFTTANTTLTNSVMPKVNQVSAKMDMLLQAHQLVRDISNYGTLAASPLTNLNDGINCGVTPASCWDATSTPGYTFFQNMNTSTSFNPTYWGIAASFCWTTIPNGTLDISNVATTNQIPTVNNSATGGTAMPANIVVSCQAEVEPTTFDANGYQNDYIFNLNVTTVSHQPNVDKTYTTTSSEDFYGGAGYTYQSSNPAAAVQGDPTLSTITGNASLLFLHSFAEPKNLNFNGDLAANGATYDHDSVTIALTRTGGGASAGVFTLASHALTGNITSYTTSSASSGSIALMSGTILTRLEDSAGITPLPITSAVAGESGVLVLSAKTASTRIDGTLSISNFACDISATSCGPQNASFAV